MDGNIQERCEVVNGEEVKFLIRRFNFAGYFKDGGLTDSLVIYDPSSKCVTVDERANDTYVKYAGIHECICVGSCGYLAPEVEDSKKRCAAIDKMLIANMSKEEADAYVKKRIEMFETLLDKNLNPNLNESFKASLAELKAL